MKLVERLNETINNLEATNEELQEKIASLENRFEFDRWQWRAIQRLSTKENLGLPIPRLEIRYREMDESDILGVYGIVYKHLLGDIILVPFSATRIGSHRPLDELDLPFRDGAHIQCEMKSLNLPGYVVAKGKAKKIVPTPAAEGDGKAGEGE